MTGRAVGETVRVERSYWRMTVLEFVHWVIMAGLEPSLEVTERRPAPSEEMEVCRAAVAMSNTWLLGDTTELTEC
jgi:hypothetical protein